MNGAKIIVLQRHETETDKLYRDVRYLAEVFAEVERVGAMTGRSNLAAQLRTGITDVILAAARAGRCGA